MPVKPGKASSSKRSRRAQYQNDLEVEDVKLQAEETAIYDQC